eukprot:COSAG03_NODE_1961_length_3293_cov_2.079524_1_plen_332_part_10
MEGKTLLPGQVALDETREELPTDAEQTTAAAGGQQPPPGRKVPPVVAEALLPAAQAGSPATAAPAATDEPASDYSASAKLMVACQPGCPTRKFDVVRPLDFISSRVPGCISGLESEVTELRRAVDEVRIGAGLHAADGDSHNDQRDDGKDVWQGCGALLSVIQLVMFGMAFGSASLRSLAGEVRVSTQKQPWHGSASIPLVAFGAPPTNHSFIIEKCTILNGDYMGRSCVDISGLVDYACPELLDAKEFDHYQSSGSWCINSKAFLIASKNPAFVENTFGRTRYDYVRVDLMRDGGLAQSGFMNIFIRDNTLSLTELSWTNFVYNFNPVAWS